MDNLTDPKPEASEEPPIPLASVPLGSGLLQLVRQLLSGGRTGRIDAYVDATQKDTTNNPQK